MLQKVLFLVHLSYKIKYKTNLIDESLILNYRYGVVIKPIYDKYKSWYHVNESKIYGDISNIRSPKVINEVDNILLKIENMGIKEFLDYVNNQSKGYLN